MMRFGIPGIALALLALTACGGGSGVDGAALTTPDGIAVVGKLASRDGTTDTLSGVAVTCVETGESVVTDAQGTFHLQVPHHDEFHLEFHDPDAGYAPGGHAEHHDPLRDGADVDGSSVTLRPDGPQDWCDIEVDLDHGEILECHVWWQRDGVEVHDGERLLDRDPLCDELGAHAEVEFTLQDGCLAVEVEVEGFSRAAELDVYLETLDGAQAYLGALQVEADGAGHMETSWCTGDLLPLDASSPEDLAGHGVVLYDESGSLVFRGPLPHHGMAGDFPHHHGGDGPHHGGM